jgi:hypothetical protein
VPSAIAGFLLTGYADANIRLSVEDRGRDNTLLLRKPVTGEALVQQVTGLLKANIGAEAAPARNDAGG